MSVGSYIDSGQPVFYFSNETLRGPVINATVEKNTGVSRVPEGASNTTSFLFDARWRGVTSDGVAFWVEDDGVATIDNGTQTTFDQQASVHLFIRLVTE